LPTNRKPLFDLETPRKRFRELGFSVGRFPTGKYNAITDVEGVSVGVRTLFLGGEDPHAQKQVRGKGSARTGVTAIIPSKNIYNQRLTAGSYVLNGAGEVTGITQLMEWGLLETPILLTNTLGVGKVADSCVRWMADKYPTLGDTNEVVIPVVGECDDSFLNDVTGNPIKHELTVQALETARSGPVSEGNVGGGTGMICCDVKAGTGTSSRRVRIGTERYTIGVLVQNNFGRMGDLRMNGVPVGALFMGDFGQESFDRRVHNYGSIIAVIATDAPLWEKQISRLCKRAALGIGRCGSFAAHGSGEIIVGFSTANAVPRGSGLPSTKSMTTTTRMEILLDEAMDPLYEAVIEATEEAILNSICMAEPIIGFKGRRVPAIPLDWLQRILSASDWLLATATAV
jgi:D-aminopeptidase